MTGDNTQLDSHTVNWGYCSASTSTERKWTHDNILIVMKKAAKITTKHADTERIYTKVVRLGSLLGNAQILNCVVVRQSNGIKSFHHVFHHIKCSKYHHKHSETWCSSSRDATVFCFFFLKGHGVTQLKHQGRKSFNTKWTCLLANLATFPTTTPDIRQMPWDLTPGWHSGSSLSDSFVFLLQQTVHFRGPFRLDVHSGPHLA